MSELLAFIPEGGALVAPLLTSKGGAVFVLPHAVGAVSERHVLWLDNFSDGDLRALLDGWFRAYLDDLATPKYSGLRSRWHDTIDAALSAVWNRLMGQVDARLREFGVRENAPVLLLPQAGLGLLPLHAAWREVEGKRRYFLDDWTVSYAPSGYAFAVGRERLEEPQRSLRSLLAVVNPTRDLMFSLAEAEVVMGLFGEAERESLPEAEATLDAVMREAKGRAYLHFACHGEYNWMLPMRSGLQLAGGEALTLADAIAPGFDLNSSRLVVLSACETGLTDIRQSPDEYVGLPAGFLQAGAPAVLSTLWAVDDLSTTLLMERFYRGHLEEKLTPAAALRRAQISLRGATAGDLDLAGRWAQVYRTTTDPDVRKRAFAAMRYFARHPEDGPFSSSFYWAPFTVTGG